jgi:hypothetical protein
MRTSDIYRLKAERLAQVANQIKDPALRLEMLRTAKSFRTLSQYACRNDGAVSPNGSGLQKKNGTPLEP